jgi:hypothetical protein
MDLSFQWPRGDGYLELALRRACFQKTTGAIHIPWIAPVTHSAKGRNRTADTSIFSAVLYRLSYLGVLQLTGIMITRRPSDVKRCGTGETLESGALLQ